MHDFEGVTWFAHFSGKAQKGSCCSLNLLKRCLFCNNLHYFGMRRIAAKGVGAGHAMSLPKM